MSSKKPTLKDLQDEIASLTDDLQRSHAELVNFKRRTEEEKSVLMSTAKASVVRNLLGVLDNLDRAAQHRPDNMKDDAWANGVVAAISQVGEALAKMGVVRIEAQPGTLFDPTRHEAAMMEDGEGETEIIAEEMQAGYILGDQVIRPAMVKVTTK